MTTREKLIMAGVNELIASGNPTCDESNILTHPPYKILFIKFLKDSKGKSKQVNAEIDQLIKLCERAVEPGIKRYRTVFPNHISFSGWWVLSEKRCVAQLVKDGRNRINDSILYVLRFKNGQIGIGHYTAEKLLKNGTLYICPTREDLPIEDETKVH